MKRHRLFGTASLAVAVAAGGGSNVFQANLSENLTWFWAKLLYSRGQPPNGGGLVKDPPQ